uniref:Uncharacterized protein n=1 Tax=Anopheles farauti TaxID=69004 RepID=A0A182QJW4_9DIPT
MTGEDVGGGLVAIGVTTDRGSSGNGTAPSTGLTVSSSGRPEAGPCLLSSTASSGVIGVGGGSMSSMPSSSSMPTPNSVTTGTSSASGGGAPMGPIGVSYVNGTGSGCGGAGGGSSGNSPTASSDSRSGATIIDDTGASRVFQILYRNEEVSLRDVIMFRAHLLGSCCSSQKKV